MNDLEKRLANTEKALIGLWSLIEDTLPPAHQKSLEDMMEKYFEANIELGMNSEPVEFEGKLDKQGDK